MKKTKQIVAASLALAITLFSGISTNVAFADTNKTTLTPIIQDITIAPGKDSSEINLNWYSSATNDASVVQVALKSDFNGTDFPTTKAQTFKGSKSQANNNFFTNKVTATGLKENTSYVYRIGDGTTWSSVYNYNTYKTSRYNFFVTGDPQIGASGNINKDTAGWIDTINKATQKFGDSSFLISVGDQVNNGKEVTNNDNETEYVGFFAPQQFRSLPIAAVPGNHEAVLKGHNTHFNNPNLSNQYGLFSKQPTTGSDYYFTYGNVLYLMLNSNNTNSEEHKAFMQSAIAANPNVKWKVAVLHHSIYSSATHQTDADIVSRRNTLPQIFDSLGIDVVLDGHDHAYTRTYQMKGNEAQTNQTIDPKRNVINPTGTLYITENSASGSKYYELLSPNKNYFEAFKDQSHVPTFSRVSIDDNNFSITTYRTDSMLAIDSYTIVKNNQSLSADNTLKTNVITTSTSVQNVDSKLPTTGDSIDLKTILGISFILITVGGGFIILRKK
ncbi:Calcineurin-like phosphoesterase [Clostridium cavendishii DSM 21758]|uniref:Calcineurin-like phosphoesterase n=1 Tax=Clostridium cavendishii DSM 21758 TaxID=1121302 RepID=A0A1M6T476_9CLOT|nr:metallophosphoesterase family protein [Clostridium cavendishii]SHK51686.1 Calcineurin-like phosphoesterase [Clostridium cavendishii DSM 21758]